ncbi:sensor domain-containing diguanylate cyclase [Shewanella sp. ULN5]|uniref:sensor domain-containing diguanylate cyclase n=1 Tax=Shewanella sp. ULN5 TaxID=2994678 RepID=UPI00273DD0B6|nr:sensor domain-containing diguanylate cyclase [Shewanella sp. ULN5]MDP5146940.1 sensor domain-containing diguanylate cyclase [Shewanella sp. ULN5]
MAIPSHSSRNHVNKLVELPQSGMLRLDKHFAISTIDAELETLIKSFLPTLSSQEHDTYLNGKQWLDIINTLAPATQDTPWLRASQTQADQMSQLTLANQQMSIDLSLRYFPVFDQDNNLLEILIVILVSKSKQQIEKDLQNEKAFYRAVVEDMPALIYRYTTEGIVTLANAAVCNYFGAKAEDIIGMSIYDVMDAENIERAKIHLAGITPDNPISTHEHSGTDSLGNRKWFQWTDRLILSDDGQPIGYQGIGLDISERKQHEEELIALATTDVLTGLLNRRQCLLLSKKALLSCQQQNQPLSLLIIDIDLFKNINDSLGHLAGDHVLQTFATLCRNTFKDGTIIGRFGGEEFIISLPHIPLEEARVMADNLRKKAAAMTIEFEKSQFNITISIGIAASYSSVPCSHLDLLARADKVLYQAKGAGRNQVICWENNE